MLSAVGLEELARRAQPPEIHPDSSTARQPSSPSRSSANRSVQGCERTGQLLHATNRRLLAVAVGELTCCVTRQGLWGLLRETLRIAPGVSITAVTAVHCMPRVRPCAAAASAHASVARSMLSPLHVQHRTSHAYRPVSLATGVRGGYVVQWVRRTTADAPRAGGAAGECSVEAQGRRQAAAVLGWQGLGVSYSPLAAAHQYRC